MTPWIRHSEHATRLLAVLALGALLARAGVCQTKKFLAAASDSALAHPVSAFPREVLREEGRIFTSPARVRPRDFAWLAPLTATLSFLAVSDRRNMQGRKALSPSCPFSPAPP